MSATLKSALKRIYARDTWQIVLCSYGYGVRSAITTTTIITTKATTITTTRSRHNKYSVLVVGAKCGDNRRWTSINTQQVMQGSYGNNNTNNNNTSNSYTKNKLWWNYYCNDIDRSSNDKLACWFVGVDRMYNLKNNNNKYKRGVEVRAVVDGAIGPCRASECLWWMREYSGVIVAWFISDNCFYMKCGLELAAKVRIDHDFKTLFFDAYKTIASENRSYG